MKRFSASFMLSILLYVGASSAQSDDATAPAPRYSQADGYLTAPLATGLPDSPASMSQTHPGIYDDYQGEMFGEGGYWALAPDQTLPTFGGADWMRRSPEQAPLRLVALHRSYGPGIDVYLVASRLGAQMTGVPLAFGKAPTPPRGRRLTAQAVDRLRSALEGDVEVILVNNLLATLPDEAQELILQKVRAGAGLVSVAPLPASGPLVDAMGLANPGAAVDGQHRYFGRTQHGDDWLTAGILYDLFPSRDSTGLRPHWDFSPRDMNVVAYTLKPDSDARAVATLDDRPLVITGSIGAGRYVHFAWAGHSREGSYVPQHDDADDIHALAKAAHYEEQMFSSLGRAVLYAADQAPSVRLAWPAAGSAAPVTIHNTGEADAQVLCRAILRDPITWQVLAQRQDTLDVPAGARLAIPPLSAPTPVLIGPDGQARGALLEYTLRDRDGRSLDWGNTRLEVVAAPPLATLATDVVYPDAGIDLTLPAGPARTWTATDAWGRLLAAGAIPAGAADTPLQLTPDRLSDLVTLIVDQRDADGQLLARTVLESFTPALAGPTDFYNLVWPRGGLPSFERDVKYSILRRQGGMDTILTGMYFRDRLRPMGIIRGGARCALTNMVARHAYAELADWPRSYQMNLDAARASYPGWIARYDPVTIHLQDERHSLRGLRGGLTLSDAALAQFRDWLRRQYPDIQALNAEWGDTFTDFDQITVITKPHTLIERPESYARWLDFLRWGDSEIALEGDKAFVEIMDADTRGRLAYGYEGIFPYNGGHLNPYGGLNLPAIYDSGLKLNNMAYGIGTVTWELCASLNPEADAGSWLGYEAPESTYQIEPWRGVLSGANFMGWFIDSLFVGPQGAASPRLQWVESYTRPLRQGVGRMLNESTRQFDQVAILANSRSAQLAWIYGVQMAPESNGRDHHWMNRPMEDGGTAILAICRDAGLSPAYITEGQILGGRLDRFRVLIQTGDLSVDPTVGAAIAAWVKRGGVLIGDIGAGAYNHHGRRLETGVLDEVYGMRREGGFQLSAEAGDFSVGLLTPSPELLDNGSGVGNWYIVEYFEPNLQATTATACGAYVLGRQTPMCLWNEYGDGRALYLGFLLNRFRSDESDALSPRSLIVAAMKYAGVQPRLRLSGSDGGQLPGYTINHFADGDLQYTGIIKRAIDAPTQPTAHLAAPRHVYEVRTNRYLGFGDNLRVDLDAGPSSLAGMPTLNGEAIASSQDKAHGMALLAMLPYRIEAVGVSAAPTRPGAPLVLNLTVTTPDGPAPGRHVLYLDVRDPNQRAAEPYCQTLAVTGGNAELIIPLAANDLPGTWHITAREPITGFTATCEVPVGGQP